MPRIAENKDVLRKRLRRFFEYSDDDRAPLLVFIKSLRGVSEVFIFGGLIRDVCLQGIDTFRSDVDIVVRVTGFQVAFVHSIDDFCAIFKK